VSHVGLDGLDAGGGSVFACFGVIVMEIWGPRDGVRGELEGYWGSIQSIFWA